MRTLLVAVATLLFPGFAPGLAGQVRAMVAWIAAVTLLALGVALSIWFMPLYVVVRIAAAIDGFRLMRGVAQSGGRLHWLEGLIALGTMLTISVGLRFAIEGFKIPASSMVPTLEVGDHIMTEKLSLHWGDPARGDVVVFRQPCEPDRDYVKRVIALGGDTVEIRCNVVYVGGAALPSRLVQGEGCTYDDHDGIDTWHSRRCSAYTEAVDGRTYHVHHDADRPLRDQSPAEARRADGKDFPQLDAAGVPPSCVAADGSSSPPAENQATGSLVTTKQSANPCEQQLHYVVPAGHVFVLGDNRANSNDSRYWGAVPAENLKGRVTGIWWSDGKSGMNVRRFGRID
jgi:signal peptidase I